MGRGERKEIGIDSRNTSIGCMVKYVGARQIKSMILDYIPLLVLR